VSGGVADLTAGAGRCIVAFGLFALTGDAEIVAAECGGALGVVGTGPTAEVAATNLPGIAALALHAARHTEPTVADQAGKVVLLAAAGILDELGAGSTGVGAGSVGVGVFGGGAEHLHGLAIQGIDAVARYTGALRRAEMTRPQLRDALYVVTLRGSHAGSTVVALTTDWLVCRAIFVLDTITPTATPHEAQEAGGVSIRFEVLNGRGARSTGVGLGVTELSF